jgi:radical SAM protein with 4Fe4S-binding SPASM domain
MIKSLKDKFHYQVYRFKYNNAPGLKLTKPVDLSLELASNCSLRCHYCYHSDQKNLPFEKRFMDFDLAKSLIEQGAHLGVHSIKYNGRGESTLHPRFRDLTWLGAFYAKQMGGGTYIDRITNSNFYFKNPKTRPDIFDGLCNQTKVKVSFDSFIPSVFEYQRTGSEFEVVYDAVDKFYNYPYRKNTELVIQAVRTKLNKDEDIEFEVKRRWPSATLSIRDMVGGRVDKDLSDVENVTREDRPRQTCIQAHARCIVHSDGKVAPCCPAYKGDLIIGDANKQTLDEIFNSILAKTLRIDLKTGRAFDMDPCKTCSSHESYLGYKGKWES